MNKSIEIGDFKITKNTMFWLFVLSETNWNDLKTNYERGEYYVSSYTNPNINKNDIIIIYQQHKTNKLNHGIVSICQVNNSLTKNNKKIKIFRDINMNKYITDLCALTHYDTPYRISQMEKTLCQKCNVFKSANWFKKKYIKEKTTFILIDKSLGTQIIRLIIECPDDLESNITNSISKTTNFYDSDSYSEWGSSVDENNTSSEYISSDDDCIRILDGHIPVVMIPCKNFKWSDDDESIIHEFKKHFIDCKKCEVTDNNDVSIYKDFNSYIFEYDELTDEDEINKKLEQYYNCSNCKFELEGKDKNKKHMYIYKINLRNHIYHKTLLVIW